MSNTYTTPEELSLVANLDLTAKEGKTPAFDAIVNSGSPMNLAGYYDPVVVDLAGVEFARDKTPVVLEHDVTKRLGVTTKQETTKDGIRCAGLLNGTSEEARTLVADAKAGFPLEASIGASITERSFVDSGDSTEVNGRTFQGPLIVARRILIREITICTLGADPNTTVSINASQRNRDMSRTTEHRNALADESARVDRIQAAFSDHPDVESIIHNGRTLSASEFKDTAIRSGLDPRDVELELMRADRPRSLAPTFGPAIHSRSRGNESVEQLTAALHLHVNSSAAAKCYDAPVLEAAEQVGIAHMLDVARICCHMEGLTYNPRSKQSLLQAAFSTRTYTNILSNVANKSALMAYKNFPSVVRQIARVLDADNFKEHTGVRLTGDVVYEELGGDGAIKSSDLGDDSYTYRISTFGRMFAISRQNQFDDDADALSDLPMLLGRGAALCIEELFWSLVLANTNDFFSVANRNYISDSLSSAGLSVLVQKFLEQVDTRNKPIGVLPKFLVSPPALKSEADELYVSRTHHAGTGGGTGGDRVPAANPFFGLYEPLVSPWLGASGGLTNGSDTGFYLFGDPNDVAAFGLAFLQGADGPTIESEPTSFETLGVSWRGFIDVGVCQIDHRGAAHSIGDDSSL